MSPGNFDRVYFYIAKTQSPAGPIGTDYFSTREQALCAHALLNRGHKNRARRILDFYDDIYRRAKSERNFDGFHEHYDINGSSATGKIDFFSQLCVIGAVNLYTYKTGDKRFIGMAKDMGELFKKNIDRWGAFSKKDSKINVRENLAAYAAFGELAALTGELAWADLAKRVRFVIEDLFFDKEKKMLKPDLLSRDFYSEDQVLGKIILGWDLRISSEDSRVVEDVAWRELAMSFDKKKFLELEKYVGFPPSVPDGAFISNSVQGDGVNLVATTLYTFIYEDFMPFNTEREQTDKMMQISITSRGEEFLAEGFESDVIDFYRIKKPKTANADVFIEYDEEVKKEGERSLRIQFAPVKNEKSSAEVSRIFYPPQDFTKFGRMKFWLIARPSVVSPGAMGIRVKLKIIDSDGNEAVSNILNHSPRGFENTVVTPGGFTHSGKISTNFTKIKELVWMFEEDTQRAWNVHIDDIRME